MLSITTKDFDLNGHVLLNPDADSRLFDNTRRVSRTATLDGGCSIDDQGFSYGDRTLDIRQTGISADTFARLQYICRTYSSVRVSQSDGVFSGCISSVKLDKGTARVKILIKEKI